MHFLARQTFAAGNYTSLNLTFSNPELTFRQRHGRDAGRVCFWERLQIKPSGTLTATVNGLFYSTSGSQTGVLVDLNLANLITPPSAWTSAPPPR